MREARSYGQRITDDFDFHGIDPDPPMLPPTAFQQAFGWRARLAAEEAAMTTEQKAERKARSEKLWDRLGEEAEALGRQANETQKRLTAEWRRECEERERTRGL